MKKDNHYSKSNQPEEPYVEILGDTVLPKHVFFSTVIGIILGLGGFLIGKYIFTKTADESMVLSYSLMVGIGGCILALIINAILFKPKRVLTENEIHKKDIQSVLDDLQINEKEEAEVLAHDPATRQELEDLHMKEIFMSEHHGEDK